MGSVDRHSHDAEWVRGPGCGRAGGAGEGLASSPKPADTVSLMAASLLVRVRIRIGVRIRIRVRIRVRVRLFYLLKATRSAWPRRDGFSWFWSSASLWPLCPLFGGKR